MLSLLFRSALDLCSGFVCFVLMVVGWVADVFCVGVVVMAMVGVGVVEA